MSFSSLPQELRDSLSKTGQFVSRAILISPRKLEGTVIFDQNGDQPGVRGSFIPTKTRMSIAENESCQLLLEKSNVVLNVKMSPARSETSDVALFRFELAVWEPMA